MTQTAATGKMATTSKDSGNQYFLTIRLEDNVAIGCDCPDATHRHHTCKHQHSHNNTVAWCSLVSFLRNFAASCQEARKLEQVVAQEVQKCQQARESVELAPIAAHPETAAQWRAVYARQRKLDRATVKQYRKSVKSVKQAQEVAA